MLPGFLHSPGQRFIKILEGRFGGGDSGGGRGGRGDDGGGGGYIDLEERGKRC